MGGPVTATWVLSVLVLLMWGVVLGDIALQPRMSGRVKAAWVVACTLMWPMLVVYWLTRPVQGRVERVREGTDPRSELVEAVLAHESGRVDAQAMAALIARLRQR